LLRATKCSTVINRLKRCQRVSHWLQTEKFSSKTSNYKSNFRIVCLDDAYIRTGFKNCVWWEFAFCCFFSFFSTGL